MNSTAWTQSQLPVTTVTPLVWMDTEPTLRREWSLSLDRLNKLHALQNNWDGEGAIPPTGTMLASVQILFLDLYTRGFPAPSHIVPTLDGAVAVEWRLPRTKMSFESLAPYLGEWLLKDSSGNVQFKRESW